ncbi:MAG TPA: hypothetical protein VHO90_03860 [Bacteroidales bacterium]|nr:hypothetical protein [Bacteroidales bacterium]
MAEIIKTSPQNGMVLIGPRFKVVKFDSVEVISVHKSDTDLLTTMPSNTVKMMDPKSIQEILHIFDKKTLFVRANVNGKVESTVTLPAPFVMKPIPPELSLEKKTTVWTVIRSKDGEWTCEMVLGVETAGNGETGPNPENNTQ